MTHCDKTTPVTAAMIRQADADITGTIAALQQDHHLPAQLAVRRSDGIAASIFAQAVPVTVTYDPAQMACLTNSQQKAVLLHEVGHYQRPGSISIYDCITSCVLLAGACASFGMRMSSDYADKVARKHAERLPKPSRLSRFWWTRAAVASWSAFGLYLAAQSRADEKQADLYAAQAMGSGLPLATGLATLDRIESRTEVEQDGGGDGLFWQAIGQQIKIFGVLGVQVTHPPLRKRVKYLQAYKAVPARSPRL